MFLYPLHPYKHEKWQDNHMQLVRPTGTPYSD